MNATQLALHRLGIIGNGDERMDDKFTAVLEDELEFIKSRTFDIQYPELKARMFIPVSNEADPGAESITYRQWDEYGMAKIIANYADDLELVDALVEEFTSPVQSIGKAYQWSVQDLRRAAMSGSRLDQRRAMACRRAIERAIEQIAAFGAIGTDPAGGLEGLLNHSNVPLTPPITGTWSAATPAQIIADLNELVSSIVTATKETQLPDTIIMDQASFALINQTPIAIDNQTTILRSFLANNPYIRNIDTWFLNEFADVAGTGPRLVCYKRDPEIMSLEIPQEFEQFPPEARNLSFVVNTHARVGGVLMYYPLAVAYMDGI